MCSVLGDLVMAGGCEMNRVGTPTTSTIDLRLLLLLLDYVIVVHNYIALKLEVVSVS